MTIAEFEAAGEVRWKGVLLALWLDGQDDWERAHAVAQDIEDSDGAWVHAYLHRKEGDEANATYWYRCAGRPMAKGAVRTEWEAMVLELLSRREGA